MEKAVIIDSVRLAVGKLGGALINEEADKIGASVIGEVVERAGINPELIDEVIMGHAKQTTDISNLARVASLEAGLPITIPGYTVHRACGSGIEAVNSAAQQIESGYGEIIIAGGAESMSTAPYYVNGVRFGVGAGNIVLKDPNTASQPGSQPKDQYPNIDTMGYTAEVVAEKYGISREDQDEYALRSQQNARTAIDKGFFDRQILPYTVKTRKSEFVFKEDEHLRATSLEKLSKLRAIFVENGTVTAGNASGRNDGAAALVVTSESKAKELGLKPKARIISQASAGVDPNEMGMGPVPAIRKAMKLLEKDGITLSDIDLFEINEAFASQTLACIRELDLDIEKVNPNGGAIAMGHPIGATGAILYTKLIHELERTGKRYGIVSACVGGGLGIASVVENLTI